MDEKPDPSRQEITARIKRRLVGWCMGLRAPEIRQTIGPYDPTAFDRIVALAGDLEFDLLNELSSIPADEFAAAFDNNGNSKNQFALELSARFSLARKRLEDRFPNWYAGGLGREAFAADFAYWSKMPRLSVLEAMALSLGVEPKHFDRSAFESLAKESHLPVVDFILRRHELLRRRFNPHGYVANVDPKRLAEWIDSESVEVPPDFKAHFGKYAQAKPTQGTSAAQSAADKMDRREKTSLAKLLVAIAVEEYGYDPSAARSPIPNEIASLTDRLGISVSHDTILNYLRLGASHLPPDWKPHK